jgi:uncharacterized protein (TIGR03437 family)
MQQSMGWGGRMDGLRPIAILLVGLLGAVTALAQKTTNFTFDYFALFGPYVTNQSTSEDFLAYAWTGSAGSLGTATLVIHTVVRSGANGPLNGQATAGLYFNAIDSISINFTLDVMTSTPLVNALTGGTITGGTGSYAGASGSLDLMPQASGAMGGSGSVTVGGKTTPLNLTGFNGIVCLPPGNGRTYGECQRDFTEGTITGSTSLGNVTGTLKIENTYHELNPPWPQQGVMTLAFNGADSINALMNPNDSPVTFPIVGGTGAYAGATGSLSVSNIHSGSTGYEYKGTGTVAVPAPGAPIITQVKMAYGSSTLISGNGWLEIYGTNLVPADTPATGVDWSNAPEFASGNMPTRLGAIDSVTVHGVPAYIYFYCSAATNPSCAGGDQINVLSPWYTPPGLNQIVVTRNGVASAPYAITEQSLSPGFPYFDAQGHVVARHLDGSLVGPPTLFPGASTPAKAGETVILVAFGMGIPNNYVQGSAVQAFTLPQVRCFISGIFTGVPAAFISPGLVQLNVTIPPGTPSGENSIMCAAFDHPFSPGAMITVQ